MGATASDLTWHDVRDMPPEELADLLVRVHGPDFEAYRYAIIEKAVGGGIVCALDAHSLRQLMADTTLTFKPHQDIIMRALDELKKNTEAAIAAIASSGSPYTIAAVRALKTHNAAYITFTKEGDSFRAATKLARNLRQTIESAWDPPSTPVTVRLRGSGSLGVTQGPLLHEVEKALNVIWLLSAGSLEDPFCLMEVCAAIRRGVPVLPVRLMGKGMKPLEIPLWHLSQADDKDSRGGGHEKEEDSRRRVVDAFYVKMAQALPKPVQVELHHNRFLVRDVIAAVRVCFDAVEATGRNDTSAAAGLKDATASDSHAQLTMSTPASTAPPTFDMSALNIDHEHLLMELVGANPALNGEEAMKNEASLQLRTNLWNWERLPEKAQQARRIRASEAVPWRTDDEVSELIGEENAEADDLAGKEMRAWVPLQSTSRLLQRLLKRLLVKRLISSPWCNDTLWGCCKGLADLAARDSDGQSAVRRQGGIQAVLTALAACPRDADVQRWGCQVLVHLFEDPAIAAEYREAGIAAVLRVFAALPDIEAALGSGRNLPNTGRASRSIGGIGSGSSPGEATSEEGDDCVQSPRENWARAIKKVEVGRVKRQRRESQVVKDAIVGALQEEEASLTRKIEESRKSVELEVYHTLSTDDETPDHEIETESTSGESSDEGSSSDQGSNSTAATRPQHAAREHSAVEKEDDDRGCETTTASLVATSAGHGGKAVGAKKCSAVDTSKGNATDTEASGLGRTKNIGKGNEVDESLALEQRRLEDQDGLEHDAEVAEMKRLKQAKKRDPWAMTDGDIAIYDKAFVKLDKDKDGFISLPEAKSMFTGARTSKQDRRKIWELCDPYRRGKLTKHGWRVAYHLARSVKTRRLPLPETLPACLYPPGYQPVPVTLLQEAAREVSTGNEPVNDSSTCSRNVQSGGTRARGTPRRVEGKPPAVSFSPAEGVQDPAARDAVGPSDVQGCSSAKVKTRASPDGGAKAVRSTKDKKRRPIRDSGGGADKTSVPQRQKSPEREADGLKKNTKAGVKGVKESARGEDKGQGEQRIGDHGKSSSGEGGCSLAASVVEEENAQERDNERDDNEINKKGKPKLSAERRDHLYAMSTTERCRYDVIFMQIDTDDGGTVDGREAAKLLGKSDLTREQLHAVWEMADVRHAGALDPSEWALAMHLARCITNKGLPLPKFLPKSLGGPGPSGSSANDGDQVGRQWKGSKAKREAEDARHDRDRAAVNQAVRFREQTASYRLGKITAAAFYLTLAEAFGSKRHAMVPKVALSLPLDKARALVAAAGLGEEVLQETEAAEVKLRQLRLRREKQSNVRLKSTTSGATTRDVQLVACRLANCLCVALDGDSGDSIHPDSNLKALGGSVGHKSVAAAAIAAGGGVNAVALLFRMFGASDQELMVEAITLSVALTRASATAPISDGSASEASSNASTPGDVAKTKRVVPDCSSFRALLHVLHAPSVCRRIAQVAKTFPSSRKVQRMCCLLVSDLGLLCGAPARRCFAECCEPIIAAAASKLDEQARKNSDDSDTQGPISDDSNDGHKSPGRPQSVRGVACEALAVLAIEPGLRCRLAAAGAGWAVSQAMEAAPRDSAVQLSCLETVAMLAEIDPGTWSGRIDVHLDAGEDAFGGDGAPSPRPAVDASCRRVVQSVQTFARDPRIHEAAGRAILALLSNDPRGRAAKSVAATGGPTALCRILANSPNSSEIQLPAVLSIAKLLEVCGTNKVSTAAILDEQRRPDPLRDSSSATAGQSVESEILAAAGCELLCKSVKTFPRDRDVRLGCLKAMTALCRGAGHSAVTRLVGGGVCEQLMKIVDSCSDDIDVRRSGLALVIGIAEHGGGVPDIADAGDAEEDQTSTASGDSGSHQSSVAVAAIVNRLGLVGAVAFVAAWLRHATAPTWAWNGAGHDGVDNAVQRASDLLASCKAVLLLSEHSSVNRDRFISMGAAEALSRAIALSGRSNSLEDYAGNWIAAEWGVSDGLEVVSIRAETQVLAARAVAELAGGHANERRCAVLLRAGVLHALFAAMSKRPSARQLQKAGCMTLGNVAACLKPNDVQMLGRNGGTRAVVFALNACPGDKDVAWAGLLAVAKLAVSSENRRLLGEAGICPLVSKALLNFAEDRLIAKEGCRSIVRLARRSGFNRTALGHTGSIDATAAVLRCHPAKSMTQRWGLSAAAAMVADVDPSGNTSRIIRAKILDLAARALARFPHNATVQAEGLRLFAKIATIECEGACAVWDIGVTIPTVRPLGLYLNDGDVQHWGMATIRALAGSEDRCCAWREAGAPEAVVRTLRAFCKGGSGGRARHDEMEQGRLSETRECNAEEALCIQFQACAAALQLSVSSPNGQMRLVRQGAGEAVASMMNSNASNLAAQRGGLAALAAFSASGEANRKRLSRFKGGVPTAIVVAIEAFPDDRRVRCEGVLAVQNLSFSASGARAMTKAGVAPITVRLLRNLTEQNTAFSTRPEHDTSMEGHVRGTKEGEDAADVEQFDRDALVFLFNALTNLAAADESLSNFVGGHGACEAVVAALSQQPRDLQLQASGIKAIRSLALWGGGNVDVLAAVRGPAAIVRAQGLFVRDREVQVVCLGALEALARGGSRPNRTTVKHAETLALLESALNQFADDAEVVTQAIRTLVEMISCLGTFSRSSTTHFFSEEKAPCERIALGEDDEVAKLRSLNADVHETALSRSSAAEYSANGASVVADASRAIGTVLAAMERNPCREVCLSAFDALRRLIAARAIAESNTASIGPEDSHCRSGSSLHHVADDRKAHHVTPRGMNLLQGAKIRYAVTRALKLNGADDLDLMSKGRVILGLVNKTRGGTLAQ